MSSKQSSGQGATIDHAIAALQRLSDLFVERREQLAAEAGLSVPQWRVLEEIASEHFMPSLFARRQAVSPAAVSKLIRGLLDRGLVTVAVSSADGRQRDYGLSESGQALMSELRANRARAIEAIWGDLPEDGLRDFAEFGDVLADRIERYADQDAQAD